MRVEVTKAFKWAPDGNNVREVAVGEVLEGRGAEVALELKSGRLTGDAAAAERPAVREEAKPEPERVAEQPKPAEPEMPSPAPTPAAAPSSPARKRR